MKAPSMRTSFRPGSTDLAIKNPLAVRISARGKAAIVLDNVNPIAGVMEIAAESLLS